MKVSAATLALAIGGLAACGDSRSTDSSQELQRDLQLASASTVNLATPRVDSSLLTSMETKPQGDPQQSATLRRGPGPRAVQSDEPTVEAAPDVEVAAIEEESETETESIAPSPEPTNEPVAVAPRPAPVIIQTGGAGDYGNGGGIFGGSTGRGGVVIRGGGVDGDNCEIHARGGRGRGGIMSGGPVYTQPTVMRPRSTRPAADSRPRFGGTIAGSPSSPTLSAPRSARPSGMASARVGPRR